MKLALVNPNTSTDITAQMVKIAAHHAGTRAQVVGYTAPFGAALITEPVALARAAEAVQALAHQLETANAVIVAAFGDPGLDGFRAKLSVPVTGIAEAAMLEAADAGRRFAVVTTTPDLRVHIADTASRHGHTRFVGTWTTPGDPVALTADAGLLRAALARAIEAAINDGGAEAVVIGGGPLAASAQSLADTSPVPLIEPVPAAVRLSLARLAKGALA